MSARPLQIRLLGPVDASVHGAVRPMQGLRRKSVLAVLALHAGEVVGQGRLIDLIWGDSPPATASNTLQRHISYLRGVLKTSGAIVACAPGYVLDISVESIDVTRAVRLIADSQRTADHARKATQLRAALELWRGPSLADVTDVAWLHSQARRLDDLRLDAVEHLAQARLALGDHVALVPELEDLGAQYPFREHVHELLMLALYRGGRQADALAAYRRLCQTLDDELGVGPGPALRDLEMAILRQDKGLDAFSPHLSLTPVASAWVAPAQLPHSAAAFVGRQRDLSNLHTLLPAGDEDAGAPPGASTIVLLSGTAGVGKTTLALEWAHQVKRRFPDGQLYVNLHGFDPLGAIVEPAEAMRAIIEALGVPTDRIPASADALAGLYRSILAGRRLLLLADNARDEEQVRPLLPGTPGCLVIVTSRHQLPGLVATNGALQYAIDLPSAAEARQMFARRLADDRVAADAEAVGTIISSCARLPLAVAVAAAYAASRPALPLTALSEQLRESARPLDSFEGPDAATNVRSVFSWSYRVLSEPAARLFRLVGLCAGPDIALPAAASLAGVPHLQARQMLTELTRAHLLGESSPERFGFHELLRAYAIEQGQRHETDDQRSAARGRFLDHYVHAARAAALLLKPARDPIDIGPPAAGVTLPRLANRDAALAWFAGERSVLLAIMTRTPDGFDRHTWHLAQWLLPFLSLRGHWRDNLAVQRAGLLAAQRLGDRMAEAYAHRGLAKAHIFLGRLDEAESHNQAALALFDQWGNELAIGDVYVNFGAIAEGRGDSRQALDHAKRAYDIYRSARQLPGQAAAANAVGWYHGRLGEHQTGLLYCREALSMFARVDDVEGLAITWDSLGVLHFGVDDPQVGAECFHRAIARYRTLGHRFCEAESYANLGDGYDRIGNHDAASRAWRQAIALLDELEPDAARPVRARLHAVPVS
jgi:DNA-binding SARP family transcriptional activator